MPLKRKRQERRSSPKSPAGESASETLGERSFRKRNTVEVFDLVKAYARQELLDPLAGVPRWLALGLLGGIGVMIGVVLLLLALLRGLQTETGTALSGNLSWAPYAISAAVLVLLMAVLLRQINKRSLS